MFQYGGGHVFKPFSSTAVSIPKNFLLSAKKRKSLSLSAKAPSNNSTSQRDELLKEIFGAPNRSSSSPSLLLDYAREKKASQEYKGIYLLMCEILEKLVQTSLYFSHFILENIAMEHEEVHNTPTNKDIESSQPISAHNLQHKHVMDKVMRDYNSPSATARVRAVKALK